MQSHHLDGVARLPFLASKSDGGQDRAVLRDTEAMEDHEPPDSIRASVVKNRILASQYLARPPMSTLTPLPPGWTSEQQKLACDSCIHNVHLFESCEHKWVGNCVYCGEHVSLAATAAELAAVIAGRLLALIDKPSAGHTPPRPRSVAEVIRGNMRKSDPVLVADLVGIVGAPRPCASGSLEADQLHPWVFDRDDYDAQDRKWDAFTLMLRSGSRFFNEDARAFLDGLFEILKDLTAGGLVYEERPGRDLAPHQTLFRARRASSRDELQSILSDPQSELHAPPPIRTPANRMNVERSPAFYATLEAETAIAETRPSIGSTIVIGQFKTTRPLNVVDFRVLSRSGGVTFSIWRSDFLERSVMRGLLRRLQARIARPIPLGLEHEYLETQVVADYLHSSGHDGALFESSQRDGGTNVVIFSGTLGAYETKSRTFPNAPLSYVVGSAALFSIRKIEISAEHEPNL